MIKLKNVIIVFFIFVLSTGGAKVIYGENVVKYNQEYSAPISVKGKFEGKVSKSIEGVIVFLESNKDIFNIYFPGKELEIINIKKDNIGYTHIKLQQVVQNIPVIGHEYILHLDNNDEVYFVNGRFDNKANKVKIYKDKLILQEKAIKKSKNYINECKVKRSNLIKLCIIRVKENYRLAYEIEVSCLFHQDKKWIMYVDGYNGELLEKYSIIQR